MSKKQPKPAKRKPTEAEKIVAKFFDWLPDEAIDHTLAKQIDRAIRAAARENAGLREEVAALVPLLAGERAHTSQLTCRHIACHNTLMSPGVHTGETTDVVLIGIRRLQEMVATLTAERDAALARVAELEKRLPLSMDDPRGTAGALLERLESHHNPCPPNCDEEGHECVPPPDPKWARCPKCVNGRILPSMDEGLTTADIKLCKRCSNSERPGWVKETRQ